MRALVLIAGLVASAGCTPPPPPTPQQAQAKCLDEARGAAGPTGQVALGVSNTRGLQTGISIGVTDDFLRGRDPATVYAECFVRLTGAAPTIPYAPAPGR